MLPKTPYGPILPRSGATSSEMSTDSLIVLTLKDLNPIYVPPNENDPISKISIYTYWNLRSLSRFGCQT